MLKTSPTQELNLSSLKDGPERLPDPWELPSSKPEPVPGSRQPIRAELQPAISPAGQPGAKRLTSPAPRPERILLQEWLKLKAEQAEGVAVQVRDALGLLYWLQEAA